MVITESLCFGPPVSNSVVHCSLSLYIVSELKSIINECKKRVWEMKSILDELGRCQPMTCFSQLNQFPQNHSLVIAATTNIYQIRHMLKTSSFLRSQRIFVSITESQVTGRVSTRRFLAITSRDIP